MKYFTVFQVELQALLNSQELQTPIFSIYLLVQEDGIMFEPEVLVEPPVRGQRASLQVKEPVLSSSLKSLGAR
jgi:hypothetical protein